MLDGGAGYDVLDLSRINGRVELDQDLHWAKVFDPVTGEQIATYSVLSFDKVIGNDLGTTFWAPIHLAHLHRWRGRRPLLQRERRRYRDAGRRRRYVPLVPQVRRGRLTDRITDFSVGTDKLDLRDFLKGQASRTPSTSKSCSWKRQRMPAVARLRWSRVSSTRVARGRGARRCERCVRDARRSCALSFAERSRANHEGRVTGARQGAIGPATLDTTRDSHRP